MTYTQTYDQGSLFMNYMNAKTYLESHRDDCIPSFALAPYSAGYITERLQTRVIVAILDPKTIVIIAGPYEQLTPVNCSDGSGHFPVLAAILIGLGATALVGGGLIVGGRLSGNEALTNIGDTIISVGETAAGIAMIATGVGGPFGMALLGTGIGSFTNGLITMSNGGSYHAGWAGGQLSGALSLISYFGGAIGAFAGSALTDLIDSDYGFNQIDLAKAGASAGIAFGLSWFGNAVPWVDIQFNKAAQFVLSYDYALLGISNSIINVYWRGRQK